MSPLMHTGWQVTSIDPSAYTTNAKGDAVYGARIRFTTTAGNDGSVFVPDDYLTPENVTAEINKRAAIMDTIAALQQPPGQVDT